MAPSPNTYWNPNQTTPETENHLLRLCLQIPVYIGSDEAIYNVQQSHSDYPPTTGDSNS